MPAYWQNTKTHIGPSSDFTCGAVESFFFFCDKQKKPITVESLMGVYPGKQGSIWSDSFHLTSHHCGTIWICGGGGFGSVSRCWRRRSSAHFGRWSKQSADRCKSSETSHSLGNNEEWNIWNSKTGSNRWSWQRCLTYLKPATTATLWETPTLLQHGNNMPLLSTFGHSGMHLAVLLHSCSPRLVIITCISVTVRA